jgi:ubiquinone/menaquinone biosynthesis C-methylase UbiE
MGWNWNAKHKVQTKDRAPVLGQQTSEEYWARHNVTNHLTFKNATESLRYLDWRNDQYIGYIDLLPVSGHDKETILDFGCGPGNDLVGFLTYSKPARLVGADVSAPSLEEARSRLELHGADLELIKLFESNAALPFADGEFDYIHCSGVLMCTKEPDRILCEFNRVLKPRGYARLMVYNYDSIWLHLYVAYVLRNSNPLLAGLPILEAFKKSTDGEDCPVNNCWTVARFTELAESAGFQCRHLGNAISLIEMSVMHERFAAAQSTSLELEHRKFILSLTFDERLIPHYNGQVAGIDGCYELRKAH